MRGQHGRYKVVGDREYLGVKPGREFVASLQPSAEARAVKRGDIVLLERITPTIDRRRATFPKGWLE